MGVVTWVIFGALAGWIAGRLVGDHRVEGCLTNLVVGIAGAVIGGGVYQLAAGQKWDFGFDITSFVVAVLGAVILLVLLRYVRE